MLTVEVCLGPWALPMAFSGLVYSAPEERGRADRKSVCGLYNNPETGLALLTAVKVAFSELL